MAINIFIVMTVIACSILLSFRETRLIGVFMSGGLILLFVLKFFTYRFAEAPSNIMSLFTVMMVMGCSIMLAIRETRLVGAFMSGALILLFGFFYFTDLFAETPSNIAINQRDDQTSLPEIKPLVEQGAKTAPIAVNSKQSIKIQDTSENAVPPYQQFSSNFPFDRRLVQNVLLPLPPLLPDVTSPEAMQNKIAALETAINAMSRVLAKIMSEKLNEPSTATTGAVAAKTADSTLAATITDTPQQPVQIQPVSTNGASANAASAEKLTDKTTFVKTADLSTPTIVQRPDWVDKPSRRVGDSYQMSVATGPYSTRLECEAKIPALLQSAVDQYVEAYMGSQWVGWVSLPPEKLRQLVADQWDETRQYSVGMMTQIHLLLNFDKKAKELINDVLNLNIFTQRAAVTATGLIGVWLLLAVVWGYLKSDLTTKGAYRNRLRATAAFAILTIVVISMMVLRSLA